MILKVFGSKCVETFLHSGGIVHRRGMQANLLDVDYDCFPGFDVYLRDRSDI